MTSPLNDDDVADRLKEMFGDLKAPTRKPENEFARSIREIDEKLQGNDKP